jgi:hypothetical protein
MADALLGDRLGGVVADNVGSVQCIGNRTAQNPALLAELFPPSQFNLLIAIGYQHGGMNAKRAQLFETLSAAGYAFCTLPPSCPAESVGSMLLPGVVVHDNAHIGVNCFISSNTVIGHDAVIGAHSWINANVSLDGGAVVGERCVIGAGAVIGAGVTLGARTLVGPGAVILEDTEPDSVWLAPAAQKHRFSSAVFGRMQT